MTFPEQEFEVGANSGNVAPDRCGSQSEILEVVNEFPERPSSDLSRGRCSLYPGVGDKPGDVELVRLARLNRRALLEGDKIVESLDVECSSHGIVQVCLTHVSCCDG